MKFRIKVIEHNNGEIRYYPQYKKYFFYSWQSRETLLGKDESYQTENKAKEVIKEMRDNLIKSKKVIKC